MATSTQLPSLFAELNKYCQNKEHERALKTANKILQQKQDDEKVFQIKIICLINQSDYEKAFQAMSRNAKLGSSMLFEKAYCLYRLNKTQEACTILQEIVTPNLREKELLAQVLYRLEKFEQCHKMYLDIIKNSDDAYEEERKANLAAVLANMYFDPEITEKPTVPKLESSSYEIAYNKATILLAQHKYKDSLVQLEKAEELCKKSFEDDEEMTPKDIEDELATLRTQRGYLLQVQGDSENAIKLYNQVLKQKPTDLATAAVASNNVITINKEQNVFDSKKKIKAATAEAAETKMTASQKFTVAYNHCLLLLHTNQLDQCKKLIDQLAHKYPKHTTSLTLLRAALLHREKLSSQAIDLLTDFCNNRPQESLEHLPVSLTLCQLLLSQGHISQACDILKCLGSVSYSPGVLSALVTLYQSLEDLDSALAVLTDAIDYYRKNSSDSVTLAMLIRCCAQLYLQHNKPQNAAKWFEELRKLDPSDQRVLAHLISAYSQFDPKKAKAVTAELQPIEESCRNVDVELLETSSWAMGAGKYIKKATKVEPTQDLARKKKKKKKKTKLPKNFDPKVEPDPERWLPRKERSTYKKRKDRRAAGIGKGTQGSTNIEPEATTSKATTTNTTQPPSVIPKGPKPGPSSAPAGQKKKKKRGGGRR